jgi:hypothetical protein
VRVGSGKMLLSGLLWLISGDAGLLIEERIVGRVAEAGYDLS